MKEFGEEALRIIEGGLFMVRDAGPLHTPIRKVSVRRNEKLTLIIETEAPPNATSTVVEFPSGTVRVATEKVLLCNPAGTEAVLEGVIGYSFNIAHDMSGDGALREKAKAHRLTVTPGDPSAAAYVIDWLENLSRSPFIWPSSLSTTEQTTVIRAIDARNEGLTIPSSGGSQSSSNCAVSLEIEGQRLYVCALDPRDNESTGQRGCIIYTGIPDEAFRKKVRTALSFALGLFLVELGSTLYDGEWNVLQATARSAYSLGMRAFDLGSRQLAPLGPKYQWEIQPGELGRMVGALVRAYDKLDLANLSWTYWHACTATVHTAPAQFGAAIEALQRVWLKATPDRVATSIMPSPEWRSLRKQLKEVVSTSAASDKTKRILIERLGKLDKIDQRPKLKAIFECLGLRLGEREDQAWMRRNHAAHGTPIPEGEEVAAIIDMHLLRGLFNRMLLRMTNAADVYIDYATGGHPYRCLADPPEDPPASH